MKRLLLAYLKIFLIAFAAIALVVAFANFVVHMFYGANFTLSSDDLRTVLKQGALLGTLFCVFATVAYVRRKG
ncbi:hypothetical protein [Paraburkholderia rhynchosiae]|uniref:Uncharacterized protein n=1 Tax=Paraburkholderia rhynchosiae TaxID=487049 RepID=A0A2N7WUH8_9BURK|nr:hypothetical protein [Paraburkholderia rhynchosiae]PMS33138.1 hypothetical protein C0Z16_06400 [Paraburkholderia rhynchosiae]CAB3642250.1 hypothetical protein LMG27174_00496 [Paraburkholderia rhynchosiae]